MKVAAAIVRSMGIESDRSISTKPTDPEAVIPSKQMDDLINMVVFNERVCYRNKSRLSFQWTLFCSSVHLHMTVHVITCTNQENMITLCLTAKKQPGRKVDGNGGWKKVEPFRYW